MRWELIPVGAANGVTYGLLGAGLVLTFRASRVLNLAHGQVGAFAAALMAVMVLRWQAPYWAAFVVAVAAGALVAAVLELSVIRRLRHVPPLMTLVATLGAAQLLQFAGATLAEDEFRTQLFPQPAGIPSLDVGAIDLPPASVALLVLGPLAVALLARLLRRTTFGLTLRATSDEPDAARALGVPARRYATAAWALGGALSAMTGVLVMATNAAPTADALGPTLLIRALAAAVVARMASLPIAVAAGVGIGVVEQAARASFESSGPIDLTLLALVVAAVLLHRPPPLRRADPSAWSAFEPWRAIPPAALKVPLIRLARRAPAVVALVLAAVVPLVAGAPEEGRLAVVACSALVAVSVWLVASFAGEVSLGHFAIAGIGATAAGLTGAATGNPGHGLVAAVLTGTALAALIAAITSRGGGFALAVLTLAFAVAAETAVLPHEWALAGGIAFDPLRLGPLSSASSAGAYLICVLALATGIAWAHAVAKGRFGRRLRAMRDNRTAARAYGIDVRNLRLAVISLSGAIAGIAGALLAHVLQRVSPAAFPVSQSVDVLVMAVVGGLAVAAGPLLGALVIAVLPALVDVSAAALAATAMGWLALLLYAPGGLAGVLQPVRDAALRMLLRLAGHDPQLAAAAEPRDGESDLEALTAALVPAAAGRGAREAGDAPVLELDAISKRFGDVAAVAEASLAVADREIVAIVGPNGAGKTTLLDLACGLEPADAGRTVLDGEDMTCRPADERARRGLARSFQEVWLFPTLTVRELVLLGSDAAERRHQGAVPDLVRLMGLEVYADARVRELSTGMRRVAELAAMLAMRPRLLVLDEPSAGLAEPEAEALAHLLRRVRDEAGVAMLIVEHDLRLVAAIADRVILMDSGAVAMAGAPEEVLGSRSGDAAQVMAASEAAR